MWANLCKDLIIGKSSWFEKEFIFNIFSSISVFFLNLSEWIRESGFEVFVVNFLKGEFETNWCKESKIYDPQEKWHFLLLTASLFVSKIEF